VQLVIEVYVKLIASATAPHRLVAPTGDHGAVRGACQVSYVHLESIRLV
jgi:hypothetical protein